MHSIRGDRRFDLLIHKILFDTLCGLQKKNLNLKKNQNF
jgi:hypothetical protein